MQLVSLILGRLVFVERIQVKRSKQRCQTRRTSRTRLSDANLKSLAELECCYLAANFPNVRKINKADSPARPAAATRWKLK